jgi:hypothetical protein
LIIQDFILSRDREGAVFKRKIRLTSGLKFEPGKIGVRLRMAVTGGRRRDLFAKCMEIEPVNSRGI